MLPIWPCNPPTWFDPESMNGPIVIYDIGNEAKDYDYKMHSPIGCNMFIKKINFEKYGYFRTDLGRVGNSDLRGEDIDIYERLRENNEKM